MRKRVEGSTKRKGDSFEQEVAELYAAMAYDVRRHVSLDGQEVDLLASRHIPGGGEYKVIVECKYKGGNTLASNQDVQSIAGAFQIARTANHATACVLVTNNGFSLAAQEATKNAGIHLVMKRDLVRSLIDFSSYLHDLRERYYEEFGEGKDSWVFRTMIVTCIHTALPLLPYESAGNSRGSISTKRQYCFRLKMISSIVHCPLQITREV